MKVINDDADAKLEFGFLNHFSTFQTKGCLYVKIPEVRVSGSPRNAINLTSDGFEFICDKVAVQAVDCEIHVKRAENAGIYLKNREDDKSWDI